MAFNSEEKRMSPRIRGEFKLSVAKNIPASSIDFSEGGVSFNSAEEISSPTMEVDINFPDAGFKTSARLVWKRDMHSGSFYYGVEFVNINKAQQVFLRQELIKAQIKGLLNSIKDLEMKGRVEDFFQNGLLHYENEIDKIILRVLNSRVYSYDIEKQLEHLNTEILLKGYCLQELLSNNFVIQQVKDSFRKLVGAWIYKGSIVKLCFEKPRGYPGDYQMLEMIYENKPISSNIGEYFDALMLKSPYAVAVRMRKDRIKGMLEEFINETKSEKIKILSVGCGSCREIRDLMPHLAGKIFVTFSCLDNDSEALKFSQDSLLMLRPKNVDLKFIQENIYGKNEFEKDSHSWGKQNLIYSLGVMDYLADQELKKLIFILFDLLQPQGKLVLTHKNKEKTFPTIPPDWLCDWQFVPRNREEVTKVLYESGIAKFSLSVQSDDFGYILYFTLTKNV